MPKMHAGQIEVDPDQVRRLVARQFPEWSALPVTPVTAFGTDHALFRLGDELVARMPIIDWAVEQAQSDRRWLPILEPWLPLRVPTPLALGEPGEAFPYPWSVAPWIEGENPDGSNLDLDAAADDLAAFVRALWEVDTTDAPVKDGSSRGVPLSRLDDDVRDVIARLGDRIDGPRLTAVWDRAVSAPVWDGPARWLHGDLQWGNLLVRERRMVAVIDFSALGVGDPAPDLLPAWTIFDAGSRDRFRKATGCDDAMWLRGQGWALAPALTGFEYYADTVPEFSAMSRHKFAALLDDLD